MAHLLDVATAELQQHIHRIRVLPIVILYLNNICDSRCLTCSIWKNNETLKIATDRQMSDALLQELYQSVAIWHTRQILLSGGEPALHPRFAEAIRKFAKQQLSVNVISNGLLLNTLEPSDLKDVSEFYLSFDAPDRESYERIRGVDGFERLVRSVAFLKSLVPRPKVVARCTLQHENVGRICELANAAREIGFDMISFLGVDVSSMAFSRDKHRIPVSLEIQPTAADLLQMRSAIDVLPGNEARFIEGGTARLERILQYFRALNGEAEFPVVRCNAPWVSTVVETTGQIRGCFFQPVIGDFRNINNETATRFRRSLNVSADTTCQRCVCSKMLGAGDLMRLLIPRGNNA